MSYEIKIRKWLWITLIIVVILGGGFTYWYTYGNKTAVIPKTSPTPTKSGLTSPAASADITTSPTASNKTITPTPTPSSTVTPNFPVPSGWKLTTGQFSKAQPHNLPAVITYFTFYTKNTWVCNTPNNFDNVCFEGDNQLFTIGNTGSGINTETFPNAQIIEVTTKDINGNNLVVLIASSPEANRLGSLNIYNDADVQIVKKSLEQK